MSITAKRISRQVRYKLNDNDEVKYSGYDMLNAINESIRYLNQSYALSNSDFLEKIKEYRVDEMNKEVDEYNENKGIDDPEKEHYDFEKTGAELPDDFILLVRVARAKDKYHLSPVTLEGELPFGTYRVFAGRIYARSDFDLLYRGKLNEIEDIETGAIDLPDIFFDCIVKIVAMILEQNPNNDVLMSEVNRLVSSIVPERRYSNVKIKMPFMC